MVLLKRVRNYEKGEEFWLILIIHIISKRYWFRKYYPIMYPTWSSKCFIYYLFIYLFIYVFMYLFIYLLIYLFIRVSKYSKAPCKIKKSVNDWRNPFKNKNYLYSPSFHIHKPFAKMAIQTSRLKNILNLDN